MYCEDIDVSKVISSVPPLLIRNSGSIKNGIDIILQELPSCSERDLLYKYVLCYIRLLTYLPNHYSTLNSILLYFHYVSHRAPCLISGGWAGGSIPYCSQTEVLRRIRVLRSAFLPRTNNKPTPSTLTPVGTNTGIPVDPVDRRLSQTKTWSPKKSSAENIPSAQPLISSPKRLEGKGQSVTGMTDGLTRTPVPRIVESDMEDESDQEEWDPEDRSSDIISTSIVINDGKEQLDVTRLVLHHVTAFVKDFYRIMRFIGVWKEVCNLMLLLP